MLLAIAAAIKLSSRGPVFYRSIRPGIGGAPFACLKFRTMHRDADQRQADLESLNEAGGAIFKIRDDPRLTPIGRLLRRFSLDELPQLFNVLRGEMSLVGPRPLPMRDFERLESWHKKRYLVLPGITGLWQVSGRSDLDFDDLVRLDFLYLERWSPFLDLDDPRQDDPGGPRPPRRVLSDTAAGWAALRGRLGRLGHAVPLHQGRRRRRRLAGVPELLPRRARRRDPAAGRLRGAARCAGCATRWTPLVAFARRRDRRCRSR